MKADDAILREFLEGTKQFIVPLFQRTYSWEKRHIEQLWTDILAVCDDEQSNHFFGSFVTMPILSSASTTSRYTIIDGQQRLTTIGLILAAIRNQIREIDSTDKVVDEINELYLINPHRPEAKYKIVPTEMDREIYYSIIDGSSNSNHTHPMNETFSIISERIGEIENISELVKIKNSILTKIAIVDIILGENDDPYLIFESLNATGKPLTQADLIRNYLFMTISEEKQLRIYTNIWLPIQEELGNSLEAFFRHYLARDGKIPNMNRIYSTFRDETTSLMTREDKTVELMNNLRIYSRYYNKLLQPENEPNEQIRLGIEKLKRLQVGTSYPLLLNLYRLYEESDISETDYHECLKLIESFIVRRAVCGIPTNVLNKYFPTIYQSLNPDDIVGSLREKLIRETGSRKLPSDAEFQKCLLERELYGNRILRHILREIERHENRESEPLTDLEIEHIMPQTLTSEWKESLGNEWELIHNKYLHTLGNLTLTGYNAEYSNKPFIEKRDIPGDFRDTGLRISRSLSTLDSWGKAEIEARAEELANLAIEIWRT
jgi:uncharacterized protein with ParB-like and HNH nuclease domain